VPTPDLGRRVRDAVAKQPPDAATRLPPRGRRGRVVDSACGYAAYSAGEGENDVLTVEFKINLLEPAVGARFVARGRVVRKGRRLAVRRGEVVAVDGDEERPIAVTTTTTMALRPRPS
jgi:acyl-coenzyme A thioesterase PaaI-like protein